MKASIFALCLLALLGVAGCVSPKAPPTKLALCIGVDDEAYTRGVRHAASDATAVANMLKARGYAVTLLTDETATRTSVERALKQNPPLVYFAGHAANGALHLRDGGLDARAVADHTACMLLDCCFVGGDLKPQGRPLVFAASDNLAFEDNASGLFTKYLVMWLRKHDIANLAGLVDYVTQNVSRETGGWQKPVAGGF